MRTRQSKGLVLGVRVAMSFPQADYHGDCITLLLGLGIYDDSDTESSASEEEAEAEPSQQLQSAYETEDALRVSYYLPCIDK